MSGEDDVLLGRLALSAGLVSREKLDECMQNMVASPGRTLADIFLEKRYLSEKQVTLLRDIQGEAHAQAAAPAIATPPPPPPAAKATAPPAPPATLHPPTPIAGVPRPAGVRQTATATASRKPNLFGKLVLQKGWATPAQLETCLGELEELERRGVQKQLGEILVEKRLLTTVQVQELLAEQDRSIVRCEGCGARYNAAGVDPSRDLKCPKCGATLVNPKRLTHPGVDAILYRDGSSSDDLLGKTIGGCKILDRLGRGGMATVYKGKHVGLNKFMAVKILPPASSRTKSMMERFIKEARAAAKIEHPNIVQVYDVDTQEGYNFILMQYVEGESVQDVLARDGKFDEREGTRVMRECAKGLDAAHKASLVHRDIKPDNIMITSKGEVKLADFGLAQEVQASGKVGTAVVAGTPYYMSPEQWDGRNVDARSDLYSLGITFYLMLTGKRPYDGASPIDLMKQHLTAKPSSPRKLVTSLSDGICAIIGKLMAKDPKARYQSADELLRDFDRMAQGLDPLAMKSMTGKTVECPFCSSLNPEKSKKCSVCGEYLMEQKIEVLLLDDEVLCPKCNSVQRKGAEACSECGARFCKRCRVKLAVKEGYCGGCADFRTRVTKKPGT